MGSDKGTNRLGREKSPYLLQHQHNPVDWFPWGEEAFAKARQEDKPIFLSIGYSTCHWCHVMERESFESAQVAEALNRSFVAIKVDREERPDVDRIYMGFVQATTGHGGWPLNVFLTPELKPFFGGTYWPPQQWHGRAGILDVLSQVAGVWKARKREVLESAESIHTQLADFSGRGNSVGEELKLEPLDKAAQLFKSTYDPRDGGFGAAPKFPQPGIPGFLLRHAVRCGDKQALDMVLHTCARMAAGGLHDLLGGGFARYSVDAQWLVPHFEKMLYDNAQLAHLYLDAFLITGEAAYAEVVRGILDYIIRDMTHPEGGFYSAEDADSEGHEGKFYCWTLEEVKELLPPEEAAVAIRHFGITSEGNFVDHSHPSPLKNQNVLSVADPRLTSEEKMLLQRSRAKMFDARAKRVRPHLDDKVLASWNGLMLGAMARGGVVLREPRYLEAAERNAAFIEKHLWHDKRLFHRWREGERDNVELLEGSAFMLDGLLHLYEATLNPHALDFAVRIAENLIERFFDKQAGAFWQTAGGKDLILRIKPDYDGAEPSGNSVAALALLRLGKITERNEFLDAAEKTLRFFSDRIANTPQAMPCMLQALDFYLQETIRIVITGNRGSQAFERLVHAANAAFRPGRVVLGTEGPVEGFAQSLRTNDAKAFLCTGTECQAPITDPEQLLRQLRGADLPGQRVA